MSKRRSYKTELERTQCELNKAHGLVQELQVTIQTLGKTLEQEQLNFASHCLKLQQEIEQLNGRIGQPVRRRLPITRRAITHKFSIGGHEGYMTVGMFEDGTPGELFVTMAKEGSTIGGLMDTIGTLTSLSLQYGVSPETLSKKFAHQRFEPSGYTTNAEIKTASSIIDYVFRWLELYFVQSRKPEIEQESSGS